jgi:hypothetical protein
VEHPTLDREQLLEKRKIKELTCGHVFHYECIHKFFYEGNKNCPNCRDLIEKEKTYFELCKDIYASESPESGVWDEYISKNPEENCAAKFQDGVSQQVKDYILQNYESILGHAKTLEPDVSFTIHQDDVPLFVRMMKERAAQSKS